VQGRIFESISEKGGDGEWQLRIALPDRQYVNLYRDLGTETDPTALASFARVLESSLRACLPAIETETVTLLLQPEQHREPVTVGRHVSAS